jgi:hypothetical protein
MMFERFTPEARQIVVQAQENARRLGHAYIGCEHLLLGAAATSEPASAVLRDHGVTPERIEAELRRVIAPGPAADPVGAIDPMAGIHPVAGIDPVGGMDPVAGIDREALAAIGIDLDVVRARIEAVFGPGALARAAAAGRSAQAGQRRRPGRAGRRPEWGKGPVAELMRRRRRRRAARRGQPVAVHGQMPSPGPGQIPVGPPPPGNVPPFPGPSLRGHIPFTPRAKKALALSLREAKRLNDNYIGVQHLTLALLVMPDGTVPTILSALGVPAAALRTEILDRYRKAG